MGVAELRNEISKLSSRDKLRLVEDIWNSIPSTELAAAPFSDAELEELDRRVAEYESDPESGVPLEELDSFLNAP